MARYLDLRPALANVDEIVLAVYTALAPLAEKASVIGGGVVTPISPTYYPDAPGWTVKFAFEPHPDSWTVASLNFGRTLLRCDVDAYAQTLGGLVVQLSSPNRQVTIPNLFAAIKPVDWPVSLPIEVPL